MIDKKDILKMAKHVFRRGKGIPDRRLLHPNRDWLIGLVFFVGLLLSGSVMSANFFSMYQNVNTFELDTNNEIARYNQELAQTALDAYKNRKDAFDLLRTKTEPVVLPEDSATSTKNIFINDGDVSDEVQNTEVEIMTDSENVPLEDSVPVAEQELSPVGLEAS